MAFIADGALDAALDYIRTNCTTLYICSQLPTTYAGASSTYALGNKASPTVGSNANGDSSGRKASVSFTGTGTVTATGTASHYALTSGSVLLAAGALSATQSVTSGNAFTLTTFDIEMPDAA